MDFLFQIKTDRNEVFMDKLLFAALVTLCALFAALLLLYFGTVIYRYHIHMQYIKMEIGRTNGREREYWLSEKRRLVHSVFPFYRVGRKKKP